MTNEEAFNRMYKLEMMETFQFYDYEIMRVPGGWTFKSTTKHYNRGTMIGGSESTIFVPFVAKGMATRDPNL